tara:strand:- start:19745 stop:22048 length:2304 start_codon:yes stop_codon:yes gene_type:complete
MTTARSLDIALAGLLLAVILGGLRLWQLDASLQSNLLALLPADQHNRAAAHASDQLSTALGDQFILFVGAADSRRAIAAATQLQQQLERSGHFELQSAHSQLEQQLRHLETLKAYRYFLLSPSRAAQLAEGNDHKLLSQAIEKAYDFGAGARLAGPREDPLGLFNDYLESLVNDASGNTEIIDGFPVLYDGAIHWALLHGRVDAGAFNLDAQQAMASLEHTWARNASLQLADVTILRAGAIFHASRAAARARLEIAIIGAGSALGILTLFLLTFRSLWPLLLSLCSVGFGCLTALVLCWNLYGTLHLLTLVFGASLVGVSVDYALHALVRQQQSPGRLPGLGLALLTSTVGYGSLLHARLPGLAEMALFSITGLLASALFVAAVIPRLPARLRSRRQGFVPVLAQLPRRWLYNRVGWLLLAVVLLAAVTVPRLYISNDLSILHRPDGQLLDQQAAIDHLQPTPAGNQLFLLQAETAEQLLLLGERFRPRLEQAVSRGAIEDFRLLSDALPSIERQQRTHRLLANTVYREGGEADVFFQRLGFPAEVAAEFRAGFARASPLTPETWLASAPPEQALLWLGRIEQRHYSLVMLTGVHDLAALDSIARDYTDIDFINTAASVSTALTERTRTAAWLLLAAYGTIGLLLLLYYRSTQALRILLVPLGSTLLTLSLLALLGIPLTLFHLFALFLVLGLGMDYGIFLRESHGHEDDCLLAILLSVLTSSLSFGLLALSATPMIAAFGLTVLTGVLCNWLLASLLVSGARHPRT